MAFISYFVCGTESQRRMKDLMGEHRERLIYNANRQKFYQSDRVKQFHRELLRVEILNDRKMQVEENLKTKNAAIEEAEKFKAEIIRADMENLEQDQQRARQREMKKKAYAEDLRQQIKDIEQRKAQKKLEKQKEIQECGQFLKQYEREQWISKQKQKQTVIDIKNSYREHLVTKSRNKAREKILEKIEEEGRRRFVFQKDQRTNFHKENHAYRSRQRDKQSQMLGEELAVQEREKIKQCEVMNAKSIAKCMAQRDAKLHEAQDFKKKVHLEVAKSMAAYREQNQKERKLKVTKERSASKEILTASKKADTAYKESQKLIVQRKREERKVMDNALHEQIAQKRVKEELRKRKDAEFDQLNLELFAQEDLQFQIYTKRVIDAAEDANRNTILLHKSSRQGIGSGLISASEEPRAKYLVPGARHCELPEYVNSKTRDMRRVHRTAKGQTTKERLGFIW